MKKTIILIVCVLCSVGMMAQNSGNIPVSAVVPLQVDVSFVLQNLESDIIFASYNRQIRGSGSSRQNAINDAISKISVNDKKFSKFIEQGREKIFAYYETNCPKILLHVSLFQFFRSPGLETKRDVKGNLFITIQ